jgi:pimeloyl-ACP methyl ester carboxylesterase
MNNTERARPDLVLLPGTMCDARLWADMVPLLAPHATLHHGDLTLDETIAAITRRLLADVPEKFHLCGFSMGGYVAREIALTAPDRVQTLVLVNTSSAGITTDAMVRRHDMARLLEGRPFPGLTRANLRKSVHPARADDTTLLERIQEMAVSLGGEVFARQLRLPRGDGRESLARIGCPALVVAARDDKLRTLDESRTLADGIPGARLEIIEECGHMTPFERPDVLAKLLIDWISK